jgi:hypothetical protein
MIGWSERFTAIASKRHIAGRAISFSQLLLKGTSSFGAGSVYYKNEFWCSQENFSPLLLPARVRVKKGPP